MTEYPSLGSLRLVRNTVMSCMDPEEERPGILVQEYDGRTKWQTVCPLTDAYFMVPACPIKWYRASKILRDMIERGKAVTLADELAALG